MQSQNIYFSKFSGGACPQTPLEGEHASHALSALCALCTYTHSIPSGNSDPQLSALQAEHTGPGITTTQATPLPLDPLVCIVYLDSILQFEHC